VARVECMQSRRGAVSRVGVNDGDEMTTTTEPLPESDPDAGRRASMFAYDLSRRAGPDPLVAARHRPVEDALAAPVTRDAVSPKL
jgi:hypothetical protein